MRDMQDVVVTVLIIVLLLMCCFCTGLTMQLAWRAGTAVSPPALPTPTDFWNVP